MGNGIAVDGAGNALVTGYTWSSDFEGANNTYHGPGDAFVAKIIGAGTPAPERGLTIVTHGGQPTGAFPEWPTAMADEIVAQNGTGKRIVLNFDSGEATDPSGDPVAEEDITLSLESETVVVVDWATASRQKNLTSLAITNQETPGRNGVKVYYEVDLLEQLRHFGETQARAYGR